MSLSAYFKNLRFNHSYDLGLGDIRLTISQQEEIAQQYDKLLDACKFAKAQIKKGSQKKALPILRAAIAKAKPQS